MSGDFQQPITVKEAIKRIYSNMWILPGIQRKFVWDKERILNIFDSLLRGYPLGTLMLWKADKKVVIKELTFYTFLQHYKERFNESCDKFTPIFDEVYSVIDGQQRLNSLYIGLVGTYATKLPRTHWRDNYYSEIEPETRLYINLCDSDTSEDNNRTYLLEMFSLEEYEKLPNKNQWYLVGDILNIETFDKNKVNEDDDAFSSALDIELTRIGVESELFKIARKKLKTLYRMVFIEQRISYYLEEGNDIDKVLDIFIRTNSGGIPLSFSNLAMSVVCSSWNDARDKFDDLIELVRTEGRINISSDFIMKCYLYLFADDIKFRIANINETIIKQMQDNFEKVQSTILSCCKFANQIGLDDSCIRAKYALLPLIYYSYKNEIELDNVAKNSNDREKAGVFLKLSLLKGLFGGSPDSVLAPIRNIIKNNQSFPLKVIIDHFAGNTKNLSLSDDDIKRLITETTYGTIEARIILSIIVNMNPQFYGSYNHIDHLYPKSMFTSKELDKMAFLNNDTELRKFYENKNNWNTLGNLQLLNESENISKNKSKLSTWFQNNKEYISTTMIPKDKYGKYIYFDNQFKPFIEERRKLLFLILKQKIKY